MNTNRILRVCAFLCLGLGMAGCQVTGSATDAYSTTVEISRIPGDDCAFMMRKPGYPKEVRAELSECAD